MGNEVVKARIRWLIGGAVVLWLSSMFFTVNEEEYAVVRFFGKPIRTMQTAGLGIKFPLPINDVVRVDKRLLVYDTMATEYLTKDTNNLVAQCYALWQVTSPQLMLQRLGDRPSAEQKLDEHLSSALGAAFSRYDFKELVNVEQGQVQIDRMLGEVQQAVDQVVQERQYGIKVAAVEMTRLSYPEATLESVFQRMREERKAVAEGYRAEGRSAAQKIKSEADKKSKAILAEANQKADAIRGEAEREAAKIFAQSYRGNPGFWRYWRKLQAMEATIDSDTTIYLTPDIELWSPLTTPPPGQ